MQSFPPLFQPPTAAQSASLQFLVRRRRAIDIFSLISSAVGGYSPPVLGAMAPWIDMTGSTSTPVGWPPSSPAKSRIQSFCLRNGPIPAFLVAHAASCDCATPGFLPTLLRNSLRKDCATAGAEPEFSASQGLLVASFKDSLVV